MLIHCDRSALGNYMRVLPTALLVSVLLELALVLECDKPADSMRKSAELPLSEYFRSPHIDWHRGRLALFDLIPATIGCSLAGGWPSGYTRMLRTRRHASSALAFLATLRRGLPGCSVIGRE